MNSLIVRIALGPMVKEKRLPFSSKEELLDLQWVKQYLERDGFVRLCMSSSQFQPTLIAEYETGNTEEIGYLADHIGLDFPVVDFNEPAKPHIDLAEENLNSAFDQINQLEERNEADQS